MNFRARVGAGLLWSLASAAAHAQNNAAAPEHPMARADDAKLRAIESSWEQGIVGDAQNRYCDKAMGEDVGWLMTPFLGGFYYGYLATGDTKWL